MTKQQSDYWQGCYDKGWKGILLDASMAHPAKYSRNLITRIIAHALDEGWIQPGGIVLDPFSGVACGALPCLQAGLHYVGVELEEKFVSLGRENINLWNSRYAAHFPNWGSAQIYQGDSRRLAEVVAGAGLVVSSPPYAEIRMDGGKIAKEGQGGMTPYSGESVDAWRTTRDQRNLGNLPPGDIQAVISSPSFAGNSGGRGDASRNGIDAALFDRHSGGMKKGTGSDPANLDHLRQGQPPTAIIASPPYADGCTHTEGDDPHPEHIEGGKNGVYGVDGYGSAEGQLGAMASTGHSVKAGVAVVGSPPFEAGTAHDPRPVKETSEYLARYGHKHLNGDYGSTAGQIGATQGQTFWEAAALIVGQCYQILPSNGIAIWVVKNYIKAGREVDFTGQWRQLCEACGFETVHIHRAMLVKHQGVQQGAMEGESVSKEVSRKSFFRRLSERRGAPKIDFETVLCMVKK